MLLATVTAWCARVACLLLLTTEAFAAAPAQSPLTGFSFLVGQWQATGSGGPGRSIGEFSFEWAAGHHALLRHNRAVTSAGLHEDILVVYALPDGTVRAVYADNEGHVINYDVMIDTDEQRIVLESAGPGPRFRLWYQAAQGGTLLTGFQVAQPGSSKFKTYLEGTAHRKSPS